MTPESIAIVITALLLAAAVPILIVRSFANSLLRVIAQCDESRKAAWAQSEKAVNRLVAVAWPKNYHTYRESSGVIEGAQQVITPHYEEPTFEEEEEVATPTLDRIERNGHDEPKNRIVATPSEYETGEPQ